MTAIYDGGFDGLPRKAVAEAVDDFEWAFDERGATLTGVAVRDFKEARIPAEVDGRPVVAIGARAFFRRYPRPLSRNTELRTVVFPENSRLTTIGESAFEGCVELRTFDFPSGIEEIGACAFKDCWSLKRLVFPASLRKIGESAFYSCSDVKSVKFPPDSELTTIEKGAFGSCGSLGTFKFPSGLEEIGEQAFLYCRTFGRLVFPAALRRIGASAFYDCSGLREVKFPANSELTTIGRSAFARCDKLQAFEFPAKTKEIGEDAFDFCRALARIVFPPSLRTIGTGAFAGCNSLKSVVLPEGLESVGTCAFWSCDALESVVLPTTPRNLGESAFEKCPSLWSVALPESVDENLLKNKCFRKLQGIATGKSVRRIGDSLFSADGETLIKFLAKDAPRCEIPPGTKRIAPRAFADCRLESVEFPEGLTEIGEEAFRSCYWLKALALPASLRKIGKGAFKSCGARTVEFPEGLTEIDEEAFFTCGDLTSLTFPASLRRIGKNAFWGCVALEAVVFPPRSVRLESGAFGAGRGALKKVVFPTGQACFADDERTYAVTDKVFYKRVYFDEFDNIGDSNDDWAGCQAVYYDAPYGPDDALTFVAPDGTPVAEYAKKNGIDRVAPERD